MFDVTVNTGKAEYKVTNLGPQGSNSSFEVNGVGPISINDVGNHKLGPNQQTWGACIMFRDRAWAFRYEGQGKLEIAYDPNTKNLKFNPVNGTIAELTSG